jgi:predicted alpha/beta hydrolase
LAATLFLPRGARKGAVLINSATAVPRKIYRGFAEHLAGLGCVVLTYDYRGVGGSRPRSLRGFQATMTDWATQDVASTIRWMRERYKDLPLRYVGHSFGGQALGLAPNNTEVSRALLVAAQAGYWGLMTPPENYRVYVLMNFVGRPVARLMGYAPGRIGLGEDLPRDVFLQWTDWVNRKRYMFDDPALPALANFSGFRGPLRALAFTDDPWATKPAVELLCGGFTGTKADILTIKPTESGLAKIGHFGFFRPEQRSTLWQDAATWLMAN